MLNIIAFYIKLYKKTHGINGVLTCKRTFYQLKLNDKFFFIGLLNYHSEDKRFETNCICIIVISSYIFFRQNKQGGQFMYSLYLATT